MSVNLVSNNALSYLAEINKKRTSSSDPLQSIADAFDIGPAYIVEISTKGRQLQQSHQTRIVRL